MKEKNKTLKVLFWRNYRVLKKDIFETCSELVKRLRREEMRE